MIEYWQAYLHHQCGLDYNSDTLKSLYFGLQTDQLILLVGNPGTGKTSLVRCLAKSFGFKDAAIIPVQSSWTDKSDLLGYYNPLEKSYMATEFLDVLVDFCLKAEKDSENLYIICLDEMNLAHIEYYFAEFLSILQADKDKRTIRLYSENLRNDIERELKSYGFNTDKPVDENSVIEYAGNLAFEERQYYLKLCRAYNMWSRYHSTFRIPKNVKFIGTLNQDATTLDISPKVMDRSYIIRVDKQSESNDLKNTDDVPLKYKSLLEYTSAYPTSDSAVFKSKLEDKDLSQIAHVSKRVIKNIVCNDNYGKWASILGADTIEDYIIASCVLPKIRVEKSKRDSALTFLRELCDKYAVNKDILGNMERGDGDLDYWRQ